MSVLIFSIPWGYFADTYGRRPIIVILLSSFFVRAAYTQVICYFGRSTPLRLVWLSSLHTVFGGSSSVANAMMFTVISDVVPETKRYVEIFLLIRAESLLRVG
jgi:MFS family permease